jgi:hypothetical protein
MTKRTKQTVSVGEFMKSLERLLDRVGDTELPLVITRRGKPIGIIRMADGPRRIKGRYLFRRRAEDILASEDWSREFRRRHPGLFARRGPRSGE